MKSEGNGLLYTRYFASDMAIKIVGIALDLCHILYGLICMSSGILGERSLEGRTLTTIASTIIINPNIQGRVIS